MNSILELKNIKKNFFSTNVLNDICCIFDQKKSYSISGISGSGKSTLFNIISGLDFTYEGKIFFNNHEINIFKDYEQNFILRDLFGLIFQKSHLINDLLVVENVMLKGFLKKNYEHFKDEAIYLLERVGLAHKAFVYPSNLSGGEQQRVAICRGIFNKPKFLLADEPTANLDEKNALKIADLFFEYKNKFNMCLIVMTHDKNLINLCEIKLEIRDGKLDYLLK